MFKALTKEEKQMGYYENGNVYGGVNTVENGAQFRPASVPTKISTWSKIRNFLFKEITVTMTPKQQKVFQEVHDFWHQDAKDFLFQEIKIIDNITL